MRQARKAPGFFSLHPHGTCKEEHWAYALGVKLIQGLGIEGRRV